MSSNLIPIFCLFSGQASAPVEDLTYLGSCGRGVFPCPTPLPGCHQAGRAWGETYAMPACQAWLRTPTLYEAASYETDRAVRAGQVPGGRLPTPNGMPPACPSLPSPHAKEERLCLPALYCWNSQEKAPKGGREAGGELPKPPNLLYMLGRGGRRWGMPKPAMAGRRAAACPGACRLLWKTPAAYIPATCLPPG